MNNERVFNIFIYFSSGVAAEYGMRHHRRDGSDDDKMAFLRSAVDADFPIAHRFALPRQFTKDQWFSHQRLGVDLAMFEEGFKRYRAAAAPFSAITAIVDGKPVIDVVTGLKPFRGDQVGADLPGIMHDWLVVYTKGDTIRINDLIHDDYFKAIKLLFNAQHLASASKLLMSCIDTLAYVEFGDQRGNFSLWLDQYAELTPLGVTSSELWEFRNAVIHMTSTSSRAVLAGKAPSLMPYIGSDELAERAKTPDMKPFNLYTLILAVALGVQKWAETYNHDRTKFEKFVERYDRTISDSRYAKMDDSGTEVNS